MIRRYSRPRTLSAGCAMPRRPRQTKSIGLTTIPSPPAALSFSHQRVARSSLAGSVVSTTTFAVARSNSASSRDERVDLHDVPRVRPVDVHGALAREEVERRELQV